MAGTLLHVTLADAILDGAILSPDTERALKSNLPEYRLGAVLIDLPFYDRLIRNGLLKTVGRPVRFNSAGTEFHLVAPTELLLELLDGADTPARQAIALGHATHYAVDLIFHKAIHEMIVARQAELDEDHLHKKIEDQLDLHVSYALLGTSGIGTGYAAKMLELKVAPDWVEHAHGAFDSLHPGLVTAKQWSNWLCALRRFGRLSTRPRAPWVSAALVDDPHLEKQSLELTEAAIELGRRFLRTADQYLARSINRSELLEQIPNRSLADGGAAQPRRRNP